MPVPSTAACFGPVNPDRSSGVAATTNKAQLAKQQHRYEQPHHPLHCSQTAQRRALEPVAYAAHNCRHDMTAYSARVVGVPRLHREDENHPGDFAHPNSQTHFVVPSNPSQSSFAQGANIGGGIEVLSNMSAQYGQDRFHVQAPCPQPVPNLYSNSSAAFAPGFVPFYQAPVSVVHASWPPSPHRLPPTPKMDDVTMAPVATRYRESGDQAVFEQRWPIVPLPSEVPMPGEMYPISPRADTVSPFSQETSEVENFKFAPSPETLLRISNEQARSNVAVDLSDWFSEAIWEICHPLMAHSTGETSSPDGEFTVPMRRNQSGGSNYSSVSISKNASPSFKRFAQQTIYQVSASAGALLLALYYLHRLPLWSEADADQFDFELTLEKQAFRDDVLAHRSEMPWRLLVLGLTLSNKWLEDNTFTTKTWHEVTGLSVASMRSIENSAIFIFDWKMGPRPGEWLAFLEILHDRETRLLSAVPLATSVYSPSAATGGFKRQLPGAIGSERRHRRSASTARKEEEDRFRPIRVIDALKNEVHAIVDSEEPVFPVQPFTALVASGKSEAPSPVSPASSFEIIATPPSALQEFSPTDTPLTQHRSSSFSDMRSARDQMPPMPKMSPNYPRAVSESAIDDTAGPRGLMLVEGTPVHLPLRLKTPAAWDPTTSLEDEMHYPLPRSSFDSSTRMAPIAPPQQLLDRPHFWVDHSVPIEYKHNGWNAPCMVGGHMIRSFPF